MNATHRPPDRRRRAAAVVVDARARISAWSTTASRTLGYRPGEVVGRPVADLLAARLPAPAARGLSRRTPWRGTLALRHRDGHTVRVTCDAHPSPDRRGGTRWTVRVPDPPRGGADAEQAARLLTERAFVQSPIAVGLYDRESRLVRANDALARLAGRSEEDMRGKPLSELLSDPPLDRLTSLGAQVLRTGSPQRADLRAHAPGDTAERAWASFLTPVEDAEGGVRGLAIAALDVSREQRAAQRLALVSRSATRIGTTLDITRTARELTDVAYGDFADHVTVDLLHPPPHPGRPADGLTVRRVARRSGTDAAAALPTAPTAYHYPTSSAQGRALDSGRSALLGPGTGRVRTVPLRDRPGPGGTDDLGSLLVVPLTARGQVLGLAQFGRRRTREPFDDDDLLLAEDLASRTASCLDNARRYARERTIAVTLQQSLLPHLTPAQNAVDVATRYLPASSQAGVGGDWYDVIPLSGTRVALVAGDVVGHGLRASATMGRLRTAVRTLADLDLPPDELLTHLDDLVTGTDQEELAVPGSGGMCATCLYAVYDPTTGHCSAASAGHPPPVVVTPPAAGGGEETAGYLDLPPGPPLGIGGLPFEAREFTLPEGSLLALYTDGLIEGIDHDAVHGADRLLGTLAHAARTTDCLEHVCDTLLATLLPERPDDDIALLLARTRTVPPSRTRTWALSADPASVADARARVTGQLTAWGLDELAFTTELVVSELVTNAIRYATAPISLRLVHDTRLICEVSDASATSPRMRRARTFDEGGRGLLLVAQLTHRWGTRYIPRGKTIWTEQHLPPAVAGRPAGLRPAAPRPGT